MTTRKKTPIVAPEATKPTRKRSKPVNPDTQPASEAPIVAADATVPAKKPRVRAKAAPKTPVKAKRKPRVVPAKQDTALVTPEEPAISENDTETEAKRKDDEMTALFKALPHRSQVFVEVYVSTMNATEAAIRAGYGAGGASARGSQLARSPAVAPIIEWMIANDLRELGLSKERVRAKIESMANADMNELVQLRRVCCRYCHNPEHVYMETPAEHRERKRKFDRDMELGEANGLASALLPVWDEIIIIGFNGLLDPDATCPECFGEGTERVFFKDTRYLSPEARAIYAGAKWGKDGLEVKAYSAESAIEKLAKIEKLYDDKAEITVVQLDQQTLEEKFASKMRAAHERMEQVRKERGLKPDA